MNFYRIFCSHFNPCQIKVLPTFGKLISNILLWFLGISSLFAEILHNIYLPSETNHLMKTILIIWIMPIAKRSEQNVFQRVAAQGCALHLYSGRIA